MFDVKVEEAEKKSVETTTVVKKIKETTEMELLREIVGRLEAIEGRLEGIEKELKREIDEEILGDVDEKIIEFVKKNGKVCADDLQRAFNYKGKNAASARLNKLYSQGLLEKKQAGRRVYYFAK
ncbi:MAG: winged helix-turn-helix domain-containing protein [Candidatus Micrarchaeia archaeon]